MARSLRHVSLWLTIVSTGILGGCGALGGGGSTPVLSISGPAALAIDLGQSASFNVNLQHGGGQGVTWTCSGTPCTSTSLTNLTSTTVTFNANGSTGTATLTATSVKDSSGRATSLTLHQNGADMPAKRVQ